MSEARRWWAPHQRRALALAAELGVPVSAAVTAKVGFTEVDRVRHDRTAPGEFGVYVIWERMYWLHVLIEIKTRGAGDKPSTKE